jgi:hypothetical protein
MRARSKNLPVQVGTPHIHQIRAEEAIETSGKMPLWSSFMLLIMQLAVQDWIPLQKTGLIRKSNFQRMLALTFEGQKLFRKHENVQEQL